MRPSGPSNPSRLTHGAHLADMSTSDKSPSRSSWACQSALIFDVLNPNVRPESRISSVMVARGKLTQTNLKNKPDPDLDSYPYLDPNGNRNISPSLNANTVPHVRLQLQMTHAQPFSGALVKPWIFTEMKEKLVSHVLKDGALQNS